MNCRLCHETRPHKGRGLCSRCYQRMSRAGRLDEFERRTPSPREHGTRRGWDQHYRRGETACEPCLEGMREHARQQSKDPDVRSYQRRYQRRWKRARKAGQVGGDRCGVCGVRLSLHSLADDCFRRAS